MLYQLLKKLLSQYFSEAVIDMLLVVREGDTFKMNFSYALKIVKVKLPHSFVSWVLQYNKLML